MFTRPCCTNWGTRMYKASNDELRGQKKSGCVVGCGQSCIHVNSRMSILLYAADLHGFRYYSYVLPTGSLCFHYMGSWGSPSFLHYIQDAPMSQLDSLAPDSQVVARWWYDSDPNGLSDNVPSRRCPCTSAKVCLELTSHTCQKRQRLPLNLLIDPQNMRRSEKFTPPLQEPEMGSKPFATREQVTIDYSVDTTVGVHSCSTDSRFAQFILWLSIARWNKAEIFLWRGTENWPTTISQLITS